jgi:hypothetical protein
VNAGLHIGEVV